MNIEKLINEYPTKYKEGFTPSEEKKLLSKFPDINMDKYNSAMMGNTCMIIDDEIITYHCDMITALKCGIENRNMKWYEFD